MFKYHILKCPVCDSDLDDIYAELIQCSNNHCNEQFSIVNGVQTFIENTPESSEGFEYQWKKRRRGKFEKQTLYGKDEKEEYSQFFCHLKITPHDIKNKNILDAGCGSTRMLRLLAEKHNANYYGIDLSESLYNVADSNSINLIRGNLFKLPFK